MDKLDFFKLYEAAVSHDISDDDNILSEARFSKKTQEAKSKYKPKAKSKKSNADKKIRRAKKDRPIEHQRKDMRQSKGATSKSQNVVPIYRRIQSQEELPTAKKVLNTAKKATSGIWRISNRQVLEIATKYHFNVPGPTKRTRHLGSTGIILWRKGPNDYYLVKFGKHQKDRLKKTRR